MSAYRTPSDAPGWLLPGAAEDASGRRTDGRVAAVVLAGLMLVGAGLGSINLLVDDVLRPGLSRGVYGASMAVLVVLAVALLVRGRVDPPIIFALVLTGDLVYVLIALSIQRPMLYAPPLMLLFAAFSAAWFLHGWQLGLHLLIVPLACWPALAAGLDDPVILAVQIAVHAGVLDVASIGVFVLRRRVQRLLAATQRLSSTDPLTGLHNRRSLAAAAHRLWRQAHRDGLAVGAFVLDLDHFKQLNDDHGHAAGDTVLRAVAGALAGAVRPSDVLARTGGEEMVVLGLVRNQHEALQLGDRLRAAVAAAGLPLHPVTASVGLALTTPLAGEDAESSVWRLIDRADMAMYRAKQTGRDRLELALLPLPPPPARPRAGPGSIWSHRAMTSATVPLPLREQAAVRDRWLTERLQDLLPGLMDDAGIDLWIVVGREYHEDPVLPTMLPASWLSARRRTILLLHRSDDGVTPMAVARYPVGQFVSAWDPDDDAPGASAEQSQWAAVRRIVDQARPGAIGIDVSPVFAHADGLAHTDHQLLVAALGPWADRLVPAEQLAVRWLETRLPEEIDALHAMNALVHATIAEAYSPAVLTVGRTTALDLAWWIRQRFHDLGVQPWFQPTVGLQRAGVPLLDERGTVVGGVAHDAVVRPGDLVHCDVGLSSLGLTTDTQRNGYVLRSGETAPPAGLVHALAVGNRMQDLVTTAMVPGRTGNEVLAAARAAASAEAIDGDVYSHPVGFHGHGAGPAIGMWDAQDGVPGAGDAVVRAPTTWALELCVRVPVPEWGGQLVRMALEQGIALTDAGVGYLDRRQTSLITI